MTSSSTQRHRELNLNIQAERFDGHIVSCRVRTSSGMFLIRGQDNIVRTIEERIAKYTMIPVENGEGFQVQNFRMSGLYPAQIAISPLDSSNMSSSIDSGKFCLSSGCYRDYPSKSISHFNLYNLVNLETIQESFYTEEKTHAGTTVS